MSDLSQVPSLEELCAVAEQIEKVQEPLLAKIQVGTLAFDSIRKSYEEKKVAARAGLLSGIPIQVVEWLPPKHIVLLDREGHVIKTLECE